MTKAIGNILDNSFMCYFHYHTIFRFVNQFFKENLSDRSNDADY